MPNFNRGREEVAFGDGARGEWTGWFVGNAALGPPAARKAAGVGFY
jgi:hypothetical protein